ncbi:MAG: hypothetical protein ABI693_19025 [Bryobacteraceae bacterium]
MTARRFLLFFLGFMLAGACPWSDELREYLNAHFWLPFAKHAESFEKPNVPRRDVPYAGMTAAAQGATPLARLREAYQKIPPPDVSYQIQPPPPNLSSLRQAVAAARSGPSLTRRDKEEVDLVEAKIEMRVGEFGDSILLTSAQRKFLAFLRTARTPEFQSEARGWLAHIYYLSGEQTLAGKIYLDELNRAGSNLSRETLLTSLQITYGYDGGPQLIAHLDEYFDTPEHAAFAIELVTNPHWPRDARHHQPFARSATTSQTYQRIKHLLAKHKDLLRSKDGAATLGLLAMRTALRMGDPGGARQIAASVSSTAATDASPDFQWMSASAFFLSRNYAAAEKPLLALFRSKLATSGQRAAAAYGLCGVYWKTGNVSEQLRFALWLDTVDRQHEYLSIPSGLRDLSVYWASSSWDINFLLDAGAPLDTLRSFAEQNSDLPGIRLVKYSIAVRLSRQGRYQEAAALYKSINANRRAQRLQQLAQLSDAADRSIDARYRFAAYLAENPNRIYYNDAIWQGMQSYVFQAATDYRLSRTERTQLLAAERELKDSQDERWRAYLLLRDIVRDAGPSDLGRDAAKLALRCLRRINGDRFGRNEEIRQADIALSRSLQQ